MSYDIVRHRKTIEAENEPSSISASVSLRQRTTSCRMWTAPLNQCVQLKWHRTTSS